MRKQRFVLLAAGASVAAVLLITAIFTSVAAADVVHVVRRGETLTSIAATDGLSETALAAANGLSPDAELATGALIEIPPQTAANAASSAASAVATSAAPQSAATSDMAVSSSGSYVVEPGDTLSGIAASAGTTVADLAVANGLDPNGVLYAGTTLTLPGAGSATGAATDDVSDSSDQSQATVADAGPYPTDEFVDGPELAGIAEQYGVPAAFAEAIGWQESGWDNGVVSSTGAVGVMQIEPDTWSWLQTNIAGDSLEPASATDNVRGGVLLLRDLLDETGGSESDAAAAYYQGLGSFQANGMYASTQEYVADVMALTERFDG